jgi:hypothetical protein
MTYNQRATDVPCRLPEPTGIQVVPAKEAASVKGGRGALAGFAAAKATSWIDAGHSIKKAVKKLFEMT